MRIALVHSFYRGDQPSGENVVVARQAEALSEAGDEVVVISRHTDLERARPAYALRSALTVATGVGPDPAPELRRFRPDVVHVHNLFPNIGDRWLDTWPTPVVVTLHNYRHLCANAMLYRDGSTCTLCPDGDRWAGVRHSCYKGSRAATIPLAMANYRGPGANRLLRRADRVIALSRLASRTVTAAGLDQAKVCVLPTGVDSIVSEPPPSPPSEVWLAAGRLAPEKGFRHLVEQWPRGVRLDIIGDGPDRALLESCGRDDIAIEGPLARDELLSRLPRYTGLVFSSQWLEGLPLMVLESLAAGLPVIVREGSAAAEVVCDIEPAWVYRDADSLNAARLAVLEGGTEARALAHKQHSEHFSTAVWVDRLVDLYQEVS